jgi:hypothetical protein
MALEAALAALGGSSLENSLRIPPDVQAQRDTQARQIVARESMPNGGGAIPTAAVIQGYKARQDVPLSGALQTLTASSPEAAISSIPEDLVNQIPGNKPIQASTEKPVSTFDRLVTGPAEAGLTLATGAGAQLAGNLAGIWRGFTGGKYGTAQGAREAAQHAQDVTESLTYAPRTEAGQAAVGAISDVMGASKLAGLGPTESITLGGIASMSPASKLMGRGKAVEPVPQTGQLASVGAAGAKPADIALASVANASPELQATVAKTVKGLKVGQTINQPVLDRVVAADTLPVPVKLMKGQMTQDPEIITQEMNSRVAKSAIMHRLNEQNQGLIANTNAIREAAAPDIYETSRPAVGQIPIDAYKAKDAALNADISGKYQALRDANGGNFPLDVKTFVQTATDALHKNLLFDHVPPAIKSTMSRLLDNNNMTFENFESMRTNLARIMRSNVDGNEKAAAGVIRDALEKMPMTPEAEAAGLKPLADAARSAAKSRFDLIASDPAYKAVITGKAVPDTFINKFVVKAPLQQVKTMKENLAHDPVAQQALASGTIDHLRDAARIGSDNTGNFAQASFNNALDSLRPKLGAIFQPEQVGHLENLGKVSRLVKATVPGSAVNTSNTATALLGEAAKSSLEWKANLAFGGIPVGSWARKIGGTVREAKAIKGTLNPSGKVLLKDIIK